MKDRSKPAEILVAALSILSLIVLMLALGGILLLGPLDLAVSAFQILRVNSTAEGVVVASTTSGAWQGKEKSNVSYRFLANGIEYESDRVYPGFIYNNSFSSGAGEFSRNNPLGDKVLVYYHRDNPSKSCLLVKRLPVFSLCYTFILAIILVRGIRGRSDRSVPGLLLTKD